MTRALIPAMKITAPIIHRGGSGQPHLIEAYEKANRALRDAMTALRECAPNGRDYYPLPEGSLRQAEREHEARMASLRGVLNEVDTLHACVVDRKSGEVDVEPALV